MADLVRRYSFKLYPNSVQSAELGTQRRLHCALYNALLQQRIEAYQRPQWSLSRRYEKRGVTLTYYDQCHGLTALRAEFPEYRALSSASMSATAQRVDRAMKAFFQRAKSGAGVSSGFPRFKRSDDYPGFSFKKHRSGWRMDMDKCGDKGRLYVQGVDGTIKFRGKFPMMPHDIRTCEMMYRSGTWWLSVVVDMPARMRADGKNSGEVRFDLVDSFARVSRVNGECVAGSEETVFTAADGRITPVFAGSYTEAGADTPQMQGDRRDAIEPRRQSEGADSPQMQGDRRAGRTSEVIGAGADTPQMQGDQRIPSGASIPQIQQQMQNCRRGSNRYKKLRRLKAKREAREAQRRREGLHVWTTRIVREFADLNVIAPAIKETTKSGKGNEREWGAAVEVKADLNRYILQQAPAAAIAMLEYKMAERGGRVDVIRDAAHQVTVGNETVAVGKELRKARRKIRKLAA